MYPFRAARTRPRSASLRLGEPATSKSSSTWVADRLACCPPGPPLVARKGFSAAAVSEIQRRMTSYKPPAGSPNQRFTDGAAVVGDADYNRIRFLCKVVLKKSYL